MGFFTRVDMAPASWPSGRRLWVEVAGAARASEANGMDTDMAGDAAECVEPGRAEVVLVDPAEPNQVRVTSPSGSV